MNPLLATLGGNPLAAIQDLKMRLVSDGAVLHDFSVGDPIEPTPADVRNALLDSVPKISQYPTAAGLPELRAAIAGWVARRFGVAVDADREVLPTSGSKEAVFHLPLAIVDPATSKRATIWGTPGYPIYARGALFGGGESDPVTLTDGTGWRLRLADLDDDRLGRAAIAWLNSPHNPTGSVLRLDELKEALAAARGHGVVLASDECYADVYPESGPRPASLLEAADGDLRGVVVAFSCSKRSGMTGYRSGALVGDAALLEDQRVLRRDTGTASPEFVQRAAIAAWSDDSHAARRRTLFDAKREVVRGFLDDHGFAVRGEATFYLWVAAPGGDDEAYAAALLREGVVVTPGRAFGQAGIGWIRLALVPDLAGCRAAVARWREALEAGALPQAP